MKEPLPGKRTCAILAGSSRLMNAAERSLMLLFGLIDERSGDFDFNFTDYYSEEMGDGLIKRFVSFEPLNSPESSWEDKLITNRIEAEFAEKGNRRVNLDPGYVDKGKLILLTTKYAPHRIYLANGIHAEITLSFINGCFIPHRWTYADHSTELATEFYSKVRKKYIEQLKNM